MLRFIMILPFFICRYTHRFQYISCYGLSAQTSNTIISGAKFQYISCYGLSGWQTTERRVAYYFNTSHVTVYLRRFCNTLLLQDHFNTSHVTVYLISIISLALRLYISIHLMLRFISGKHCNLFWKSQFQYISCYGLSF